MGYPQLLHLYPPEEILVGPGIALEEVEEIFVEARARAQHAWSAALGPARAPLCGHNRTTQSLRMSD